MSMDIYSNYKKDLIPKFYKCLDTLIKKVETSEQIYLTGDFNAHVGDDFLKWRSLGKFGYGKVNKNGKALLEFCEKESFCITNTFFYVKESERITFKEETAKKKIILNSRDNEAIKAALSARKPRARCKGKSQIDFFIAKDINLKYVMNTKPCNRESLINEKLSDHMPVVSILRLPLTIDIHKYTTDDDRLLKFTLYVLCKYKKKDFDPRNREIKWGNVTIKAVLDNVLLKKVKSIFELLSVVKTSTININNITEDNKYCQKNSNFKSLLSKRKHAVSNVISFLDSFLNNILHGLIYQIRTITSDMFCAFHYTKSFIFSIQLLQNEHRNDKFYTVSADLSSILETINIPILMQFLRKISFSNRLAQIMSHFLGNVKCTMNHKKRNIFEIWGDNFQARGLAPQLVEMFLTYVFYKAFNVINTSNTTREINYEIRVFLLMNSVVIMSKSKDKIQLFLDNIEKTFNGFGLSLDYCKQKRRNKERTCLHLQAMVQNYSLRDVIRFKETIITIRDRIRLKNILFANVFSDEIKIKFKKIQKDNDKIFKVLEDTNYTRKKRFDYYVKNILGRFLHGLDIIPHSMYKETIKNWHEKCVEKIKTHKGDNDEMSDRELNEKCIFNLEILMCYKRLKTILSADFPKDVKDLINHKINMYFEKKNKTPLSRFWTDIFDDFKKFKINEDVYKQITESGLQKKHLMPTNIF